MSYVGRATTDVSRGGVFISYARGDGEEFAGRLRERLEAEGVRLWQDRVGMEGGRDWWLQITEALDRVEFMVLVMTPNALRSETVRKEWRYARQQGVCVYPVKGSEGLDFGSLPRWMRDVHFYDLGRLDEGGAAGPEWKKFVNDLSARCQVRRVPFMVEDMPENFVQRSEEFDTLASFLLDRVREEPVAITAALRGAGGYGKTTLARALCHSEEIQEAFDEGILWVTLGESPGDLTGRIEDLIYTLTGERPGFTGVDAATARLVELLADRDMLMVVDDVWNNAHLRPFTQGGPRCARLITTRDLDTLPLRARRVDVDAMRQGEAVALLGTALPGGHETDLRALAARLGEWPLLLTLVNSALRKRVGEGQSLPDALAYANKALDRRGLVFFDARDAEAREQAVAKTLGVSFEHLDESERERYGELAAFPEDAEVPLATLTKLWGATGGLDEFDTEELCDRLYRLSLLLRFDPTARLVRLHDVVRAYLVSEQGERLRALHEQLLDAHRPTSSRPATDWAGMPGDEPYLWSHLAYHLLGAGRGDELVTTVKDLRYLAAKTFLRRAVAVEEDLFAAEGHAPSDAALGLLRRSFAQSGHILNRCERRKDLAVALLNRLQHLEDLTPLTREFALSIEPPFVVPWHTLPDVPHPALIRTLGGHTSAVVGCVVSRDSTLIVSASWDETLKVWDAKTGAERVALVGHRSSVNGCAISSDNSFVVSASDDNTLIVWDAKTGERRFTLSGHTNSVTDCVISPDDSVIVSASRDGTMRSWDASSGAEIRTYHMHKRGVTHCAVAANGSVVVSASSDYTLKVWDVAAGGVRHTLTGHAGSVNCCAVSHDGSVVVSASSDHRLKAWDAVTGEERFTMRGHTGSVYGCAVSPGGEYAVSASTDMTLKVWSLESGAEILTLTGHPSAVIGCAVSADGSFIVSSSDDGTVRIWDARLISETLSLSRDKHSSNGAAGRLEPTPAPAEEIDTSDSTNRAERTTKPEIGHLFSITRCSINADGSAVAVASNTKFLAVWDAMKGIERLKIFGNREHVKDCAISPDGSFVVSAYRGGTLKVWDTKDGSERFTLKGHTDVVNACVVSPDGSFIVSASDDETLKVWCARSGVELRTLRGHRHHVGDCDISNDGSLIVSASTGGNLMVWDARSGEAIRSLEYQEGGAGSCRFSPDNSLIVSTSWDMTIKLWDTKDGAERLTLQGHKDQVTGAVISDDNSLVVSTSKDRTLKMWDARSGECLVTLHADGSLNDCALFPDGSHLLAVGDGGVYFLRLVR